MIKKYLILVIALAACSAGGAQLEPTQDLPDDVRAAVDSAWDEFSRALSGKIDCIAPARLALVSKVADGDAYYRAADQLVLIQIPTSPARFRESLIHELAHHVDATCADMDSIRSRFLLSQGFSDSAEWNRGDSWETTPSEHFAEAIVALVTGQRILHSDDVVITQDTLQLIGEWASGDTR